MGRNLGFLVEKDVCYLFLYYWNNVKACMHKNLLVYEKL